MSSPNPSAAPSPIAISPAMEAEARRRAQRSDWFLEEIVDTLGGTAYIGITLFVGGKIVSGTLISQEEYFTGLAKQMEDAFAKTGASEEHVKTFGSLFERHAKAQQENAAEEDKKFRAGVAEGVLPFLPGHRAYVHLKDVTVHGEGTPGLEISNTLWRGRIAAVDAFFIGTPK